MFETLKGFIGRFLNATLRDPERWLVEYVNNTPSDSGMRVTPTSTLGYAPVWYAVSKIAGHVGWLPLSVMERVDGGSQPDPDHFSYRLMKVRPNPLQTAIQFREQMMAHALLWGNGRAAIVRENFIPREIIPLNPERTTTMLAAGEKWHVVDIDIDDRIDAVGGTAGSIREGRRIKIPDRDVLHVPGLGFDGIQGLSLIQIHKNVFGLGLAAERAANRDFANGSRPGVILESPVGSYRDDAKAKQLLQDFNKYHAGVDNTSRAALLRDGVQAKVLSMSADDAQWVEQRRFQRQEAALLFQLESILGDDSSVSYRSLEQKNLAYLANCLTRWLTKWEQECNEKLLSQRQKAQDSHFFKFNEDALLRADHKTRIESLTLAINSRIMNPNEAREKLDMLPYEGGDEFANPAITPGEPGEEDPADSNSPPSPEDANRRAILAHLQHIIGVEANAVLGAAGNKQDYIGWVRYFYDKKWHKTMTRTVQSLGGDPALATSYCNRSKIDLIDLAGSVPNDRLADAVSEMIADWPDRADDIAEDILTGATNVPAAI